MSQWQFLILNHVTTAMSWHDLAVSIYSWDHLRIQAYSQSDHGSSLGAPKVSLSNSNKKSSSSEGTWSGLGEMEIMLKLREKLLWYVSQRRP